MKKNWSFSVQIPKRGITLEHFNFKHLKILSIFSVIIILCCFQNLFAQDTYWQGEYNIKLAMASNSSRHLIMPLEKPAVKSLVIQTDTTTNDLASLFKTEKPRLLPKNISFGENLFWGKEGLFRKVGLVAPLSLPERKYELKIRRSMLTAHQVAGFTTLALMWTSAYFGQKVIDGNRRLGDTHQAFVSATILSYTLTGLLGILSPPPMIRRDQESTVTLHKTLAWIHLLGMIITPLLAPHFHHHGGGGLDMKQAHFHQIAGYITTAVFTSAVLVIVF